MSTNEWAKRAVGEGLSVGVGLRMESGQGVGFLVGQVLE